MPLLVSGAFHLFVWLAAHPESLVLPVVAVVAVGSVVLWMRVRTRRARRRRTRYRYLMELLALTPRQFEKAIADLLWDLGYRRVQLVGKSGDLAADILAIDADSLTVVVQCKRYAPGSRIGSPDIQTFIGMMTVHHRANRGIFVTTTEFSEPARMLAARYRVELFDGPRLTATLATLSEQGGQLAQRPVSAVGTSLWSLVSSRAALLSEGISNAARSFRYMGSGGVSVGSDERSMRQTAMIGAPARRYVAALSLERPDGRSSARLPVFLRPLAEVCRDGLAAREL